ncbi:MAG: hypothetical protein ACO1OB_21870 [Archangium sp.]
MEWLPKERLPRGVLFGSLAIGLLLRAYIVFTDDGINWPDEIYQSFEPAHRLVFGYGMVAWEYLEGARTWATPGFVAVWLWLCKLVGADSPSTYIHVTKLAFSVLSIGAALGAYRLARVFGARELEASVSAAAWSLCALALYFSPRAMSENLAAVCIVWGAALVLYEKGPRWLGASLLGFATIARLQSGVVCVAIVGVLVVRALRSKSWRPTLEVFGVLVLWAFIFGAWDAAAWKDVPSAKYGGWFHSAFVYYRVNIVENRGAQWGTSAWGYYFHYLFTSMPGVTVVLGVSVLASVKRAMPVVVVLLAFVALHLAVPHKELRFMIPILPLACALIGVALSQLSEGISPLVAAVVGALIAYSAITSPKLTMGDVGSYLERSGSSAWDDFGTVNRLMLAASRQSDVCGLRIDAAHLAWTGGITYLHRNAPLYMPGTPHQPGWFNYVIARAGSGLPAIASEGGFDLVKLPGVNTCTPQPGYSWKLP